MKAKGFAAAACALLFASTSGCASSPPSDFFILTPMAATAEKPAAKAPAESFSLGVGPVKVPEYLNRAQIVTRAGPNRLDVNEFHRWGGSFAPNISRVVAQNLSILLGSDEVFAFPSDDVTDPRYRVVISITQFDGSLGGEVVLDARWIITGSKRRAQLDAGRSLLREATRGSDYEDYVAAQSRALAALSREIAAGIRRLLDTSG